MTDAGVIGEYLDLEKAKQKLMGITDGNRIIANVNSMGVLKNDPKTINNILTELSIQPIQEEQIYKLLSYGEEYLNSLKSKFTSVYIIVHKLRIIIHIKAPMYFDKFTLLFFSSTRNEYCSKLHSSTKIW